MDPNPVDDIENLDQKEEILDDVNKDAILLNQQDENNESISRIPNEVWVLILSQINQKELVQARTVCQKWREVVDSHFEFTVIVHDGKTDLDRIYALRIRDCLITRLLGDKDIFQFPSLLRRIRFWGPINVTSFQRIMNQAVAIEELSLTKFALMQENLLGESRLNGFSKVKKLELLGYMCKDESKVVAKNSSNIFAYEMPDLERLTINFHCDISSINKIAVSFMEFISRHRQLKNLVASLVPEANHPNEDAATRITSIVLSKAVDESLRNVQLNVLRITTATKDLAIWTALLNSQTCLQDFRMHLSEGGLLTVSTNYTVGISFDLIREPLLRNAATLTSVELKDLRVSPSQAAAAPGDFTPVDASVFRFATNLKKLILYRNTEDFRRFPQYPDQPSIINLKMLPVAIEVLEISRFYCRSDELQFVVDVLENLKTIVLTHTGSLNRLGVHGGIIESIAKKTEIQTMNINPLNYYCTIENKKYDEVKAKFGMNDGDHLYYDFERFRKGLPQPRPPSTEPPFVQANFNRDGPTTSRRRFQSASRCQNRALLTLLAAQKRKWIETLNRFDTLLASHGPPNLGLSSQSCSCHDDPLHERYPNGQCPNDPLSKLFCGLDLHIFESQKQLPFLYVPKPLPVRQRRRSEGSSTNPAFKRRDTDTCRPI